MFKEKKRKEPDRPLGDPCVSGSFMGDVRRTKRERKRVVLHEGEKRE